MSPNSFASRNNLAEEILGHGRAALICSADKQHGRRYFPFVQLQCRVMTA